MKLNVHTSRKPFSKSGISLHFSVCTAKAGTTHGTSQNRSASCFSYPRSTESYEIRVILTTIRQTGEICSRWFRSLVGRRQWVHRGCFVAGMWIWWGERQGNWHPRRCSESGIFSLKVSDFVHVQPLTAPVLKSTCIGGIHTCIWVVLKLTVWLNDQNKTLLVVRFIHTCWSPSWSISLYTTWNERRSLWATSSQELVDCNSCFCTQKWCGIGVPAWLLASTEHNRDPGIRLGHKPPTWFRLSNGKTVFYGLALRSRDYISVSEWIPCKMVYCFINGCYRCCR